MKKIALLFTLVVYAPANCMTLLKKNKTQTLNRRISKLMTVDNFTYLKTLVSAYKNNCHQYEKELAELQSKNEKLNEQIRKQTLLIYKLKVINAALTKQINNNETQDEWATEYDENNRRRLQHHATLAEKKYYDSYRTKQHVDCKNNKKIMLSSLNGLYGNRIAMNILQQNTK